LEKYVQLYLRSIRFSYEVILLIIVVLDFV